MNHKQDVLLTYRLLWMSEWLPVLQHSLHHFSSSNNNSPGCNSHISWLISDFSLHVWRSTCVVLTQFRLMVLEFVLCHGSGFVPTWRCEIFTDFHLTDIILFFTCHFKIRNESRRSCRVYRVQGWWPEPQLWQLLQQKVEQNSYDRGRRELVSGVEHRSGGGVTASSNLVRALWLCTSSWTVVAIRRSV